MVSSSLMKWLGGFDILRYVTDRDLGMFADGVLFFHLMKELVDNIVENLDELGRDIIPSGYPKERLQNWKLINDEILGKVGLAQSDWYLAYVADGKAEYIESLLNSVHEAYPNPPVKEITEQFYSPPSFYLNPPKRMVTESRAEYIPANNWRPSNVKSHSEDFGFATILRSERVGERKPWTKWQPETHHNRYSRPQTVRRNFYHNRIERRQWEPRMSYRQGIQRMAWQPRRYFNYQGYLRGRYDRFSKMNTYDKSYSRPRYQSGQRDHQPSKRKYPESYARKSKGDDEIEKRFNQLLEKYKAKPKRRVYRRGRPLPRYFYRYYVQYPAHGSQDSKSADPTIQEEIEELLS